MPEGVLKISMGAGAPLYSNLCIFVAFSVPGVAVEQVGGQKGVKKGSPGGRLRTLFFIYIVYKRGVRGGLWDWGAGELGSWGRRQIWGFVGSRTNGGAGGH